MAIDRERTLRRAETLLRQGLLDKAIGEYLRLAAERPRDWATLNSLGDLYLRARRPEAAVQQYARIAAHFDETGAADKALALYGKILRVMPGDQAARLRSAQLLKAASAEMAAGGRAADAQIALRRALEFDPSDTDTRLFLVRSALAAGDAAGARACLDGRADTPALRLCSAEVEFLDGNGGAAAAIALRLLAEDASTRPEVIRLGRDFAARCTPAAFECIEAGVDQAVAEEDWSAAAAALEHFTAKASHHVPALMRLVEVCVDGGMQESLAAAQKQLTDAYLLVGSPREARVIAEDLALREPWDRANIERLRHALVMLGEPDPDAIIAERLCGDSPFAAIELPAPVAPVARAADRSTPAAAAPRSGAVPVSPPAAAQSGATPAARPSPPQSGAVKTARPASPPTAAVPVAPPSAPRGGVVPVSRQSAAQSGAVPAATSRQSAAQSGAVPAATSRQSAAQSGAVPAAPPRQSAAKSGAVPAAPPRPSPPQNAPAAPTPWPSPFPNLPADPFDAAERPAAEPRPTLASLAVSPAQRAAVALHEAGRTAEAVAALKRAVRSRESRYESALLLARIQEQSGDLHEAIEWYERATQAAPARNAAHEVLYDLGRTLLAADEADRALAVFLELRAEAPDYRDVSWQIARLRHETTRGSARAAG